jgi:hypothetical protein
MRHEHAWIAPTLEGPRTFSVFSLLLLIASLVALGMVHYLYGAFFALIAFLCLFASPGVIYLWYRADPVRCQKRPIQVRLRQQQQLVNRTRRTVSDLEREMEKLRQTYEKTQARITQERRDLPQAQRRAEEKARTEAEKQTFAPLRKQEQGTYSREQNALDAALKGLQHEHMAAARRTSIADAQIPGIGPGLKSQLMTAGIRTVADVSLQRVAAVNGFGGQRATAVDVWRTHVEQSARATMPQRVSEAERQSIAARFEAERRQIAVAREQAVAALGRRLQEIAEWHAARPAALDHEAMDAKVSYEQSAAEIEEKLTAARSALTDEQERSEVIQQELAPYTQVTFSRYLGMTLFGRGALTRKARALHQECDRLLGDPDTNLTFEVLSDDNPAKQQYRHAVDERTRGVDLLERDKMTWSPLLALQAFEQSKHALRGAAAALPETSVAGDVTSGH